MSLKQQIDQDLKAAMLAGDALQVTTLRNVKSAVLNEEVAKGLRETGLDDEAMGRILLKESKKRLESADLYRQGGSETKAEQELAEKSIIDKYLPEKLSEAELTGLIDKAIKQSGASDLKSMGQVIGIVKQQAGAAADGAILAELVKERLGS